MADRVHQRAPEPVGAAQGLGFDRLPGQIGALNRHRALVQQGQGQLLLVRSGRQGGGLDPGDARAVAHALQRSEGPARLRQGAGAVARRFALLPGPARGGHGLGVQRGLGRRARDQGQFVVDGQKHHGPRPRRRRRLLGQNARGGGPVADAGQPLAGGQQGRHGRGPALRRLRLLSHPSGQEACRQGHGPEDDQGQEIGRRTDGETIFRLKKQEVVGQKGDRRRRQGRFQAVKHPRRQHRREVDDAQIDTLERAVQQQGQARRRHDAGGADRIAAPAAGQAQTRLPQRLLLQIDPVGDDVNRDAARLAQQFRRQRPPQPFGQAAVAPLGQDDLGDVVLMGVIHDGAHHVVAAEDHRPPAQLLGQLQRVGQLARRTHAVPRARGSVDVGHGPGRVHHHVRQPPTGADQGRGHGVAGDQHQNPLARRPRPRHPLLAQSGHQLIIHRLGRAAQGQLAQGRQVLDLEEVVRGQPRRLGHIDLALGQTLAQFLRGDVHQFDVVGARQGAVRHAFTLPDAGDAQHHVRQAFQVLDVQRGPDVDPGVQDLLHVLPALGMARAGGVGVGVFVDQQQAGAARHGAVQVELQQGPVAIGDGAAGHDLQPAQQAHGLLAAVGLDHADDDVVALGFAAAGGAQHLIGLADAGRHAQKNLQPPTLSRGGRGLGRREDGGRHQPSAAGRGKRASSAILVSSTLTRGCPSTPNVRPSTCCSITLLTSCTATPRAWAMRAA
ncbi:hypothetical protein D3C85_536060 [compost metagenome]